MLQTQTQRCKYLQSENRPIFREPHHHARSGGDLCARLRRLFAGDAAADRIEVKACILRRFDGAAQILAEEGRDFDAAFFHVENDGSAGT